MNVHFRLNTFIGELSSFEYCQLLLYVYKTSVLFSGVTTDPADPAMRGGPRPMGGPKIMVFIFSLKISHINFHADVRYDE